VARAIFASEVPVISAVGHETDYTIADFVADLRAPTPSAAAEMVVPIHRELKRRVAELQLRLESIIMQHIEINKRFLYDRVRRLTDPRRTLGELRIRLDDHVGRLLRGMANNAKHAKERLSWYNHRLFMNNPQIYLEKYKIKIENLDYKLLNSIKIFIKEKFTTLGALNAQLNALSPRAILARGYSITRTLPQAVIVTDADSVELEQNLEVILARGALTCRVKGKQIDGEKDV
jgi:exodeoxyribonuclease VII large subunit